MDLTSDALDGMWLCGFVPLADHFAISSGETLVGYTCVNSDGYILQYHLTENCRHDAIEVFQQLASNQLQTSSVIKGAFSSTAEPQMLSYCFEAFSSFEVDTLMYRDCEDDTPDPDRQALPMALVRIEQLESAALFAQAHAGGSMDWLMSYLANLINRRELYGYWLNGVLVATGECRGYDEYQVGYADLGVIVHEGHRKKGMATRVLRFLKSEAQARSLQPICSTEKQNRASQKAIMRAGFVARHRIIRFF